MFKTNQLVDGLIVYVVGIQGNMSPWAAPPQFGEIIPIKATTNRLTLL